MDRIIGTVKELYIYPEKGFHGEAAENFELVEAQGIAGDCHADGSPRQIAILTVSEKEWMKEQEVKGFCFRKYKANIIFEGFSLHDFTPGTCLRIGLATLKITPATKKCPRDLCNLAKSGGTCRLCGTHAFGAVVTGGRIAVGMEVTLETLGEK